MKTFICKIPLLLALLFLNSHVNAQSYNNYRDVDAVMLRVNGNAWSEKKLEGALLRCLIIQTS